MPSSLVERMLGAVGLGKSREEMRDPVESREEPEVVEEPREVSMEDFLECSGFERA
jgi:hypothetical protein